MSQSTYVIPDTDGLTFLGNLNALTAAVRSQNAGGAAPTETAGGMLWIDTVNNVILRRKEDDSAWVLHASAADNLTDSKSAAYNVVKSDHERLIRFTGAGAYSVTFDAAATLTEGHWVELRNDSSGVVTLDPNGSENIDGGTTLALGAGQSCRVRCTGAAFWTVGLTQQASSFPEGHINGLGMSTAGSSTSIAIAAGVAANSTNAVLMRLAAAITKTTGAWAVGSGNGGKLSAAALANNTFYAFYEIRRPDTGVVDVGFDISPTTPTLPANYTQWRYIGSWRTNAAGQWDDLLQFGDYWIYKLPRLDYNGAASTTRALLTLSVPTGRKMYATFNLRGDTSTSVYISDPATTDVAPSASAAPLATLQTDGAAGQVTTIQAACMTDTSGRVAHRAGNTNTFRLATLGWIDNRGRDE